MLLPLLLAAGLTHVPAAQPKITGFHVSDGDPSREGILGAKLPRPFEAGWRAFYTQQHGDSQTWEIVRASRREDD
jgi:hypothetical protein